MVEAVQFLYPFDDVFQATVDANGEAIISFGPNFQVQWNVSQVSLEMPTAPSGSSAVVRKNGALVAPAFSARKAAIGGDPPIFLRPGDRMTVEWEGCTPGDAGRAFVVYNKVGFGSA